MTRIINLVLTSCCLLIFCSSILFADDFEIVPSLSIREEYDDNIHGNVNDEVDDFVTRITPSLKIANKTERINLGLSGYISKYFYADTDDYDHTDQNYSGNLSYNLSEQIGISANAAYDVTYRPDRDIETTGLVVSNDRRERQNHSVGVNFNLSELSVLSLSGRYLDEKWSEDADSQDLESFSGYMGYTIDLGTWLERTIGRFNAGFARYEYETLDIDYYYATIGIKYNFTETVNILVDIGINKTDTNYLIGQLVFDPVTGFQIITVEQNHSDYGGVGTVVLEKRGELTRGSLKISQDIKPSSYWGSNVERSELVLNWRRKLGEISAVSVSGGLFKNKADSGQYGLFAIDEKTFFIRPTMRWEIFRGFMLDAGYYYSYTKNRVNDYTRNRNLVYLQLSYGLPLFE